MTQRPPQGASVEIAAKLGDEIKRRTVSSPGVGHLGAAFDMSLVEVVDFVRQELVAAREIPPVPVRSIDAVVPICHHDDGVEHVLEPDDDGLVTFPCDVVVERSSISGAIKGGRPVMTEHPDLRDAVVDLEVALRRLSADERARARRYIATVYLTPYGV